MFPDDGPGDGPSAWDMLHLGLIGLQADLDHLKGVDKDGFRYTCSQPCK